MTYISQLDPEKQIEELDRLYRKVFTSPEGRIVFTDLLQTMCVFDVPSSDDQRAVRDFATILMSRVLVQDSHALVDSMLSVEDYNG